MLQFISQCPFTSVFKYVSSFMSEKEKESIDPRIEIILKNFNKVNEFVEFAGKEEIKNAHISYKLLSDEECAKSNIDTAMVVFRRAFFKEEKIEILLKKSMSDQLMCRSVLMEICNIFYRNEYFELESLVKEGKLEEDRFAIFMENIEFKAYNKAISIAGKIDALNIYPESLYSAIENRASKNFDNYYSMSASGGHVEKYIKQWAQISQ